MMPNSIVAVRCEVCDCCARMRFVFQVLSRVGWTVKRVGSDAEVEVVDEDETGEGGQRDGGERRLEKR